MRSQRVKKADCRPGPEDVRVACVFCSGYWESREAFAGLVHSVPPCSEFEAMDVVDFMQATRKKMGIVAPWDLL
jgi:hypothetical protein